VYSGHAGIDGQNVYCSDLVISVVGGRSYLPVADNLPGPNGHALLALYGLTSDGSFGKVTEYGSSWEVNSSANGQETHYLVDGDEVGEEEATSHAEKWHADSTERFYLGALASTDKDLEPTLSRTRSTLEALGLEGGQAGEASSEGQESSSSSSAESEVVTDEDEESEFVTPLLLRKELEEINAARAADERFAATTEDMKSAGLDYVERYQNLMDKTLDFMDGASGDYADVIASQQAWEEELDSEVVEVAESYGTGTGRGPAALAVRMDGMRDRIDELINTIVI